MNTRVFGQPNIFVLKNKTRLQHGLPHTHALPPVFGARVSPRSPSGVIRVLAKETIQWGMDQNETDRARRQDRRSAGMRRGWPKHSTT